MLAYAAKRLLALVPVLFVVSLAMFLVVYLIPGGPATAILGMEATPDRIDALNAELGFDRPFLAQYLDWLAGVVQGDWGESFFLHKTVLEAIGDYFLPTISLAVLAQLIGIAISVPLGIHAACHRGKPSDVVTVVFSMLGAAIPAFLLGMFLMLFFSVYNHWFPVAGYVSLGASPIEHFRHLFVPALSLGVVQAAYLTRMIRAALLDVLCQDYIRTARAKGLGELRIVLSYALKNGAPVILTALGQSFAGLITGAIVTETIFNIPGLGMLTMTAIARRDVFVIQGVVLFVTILYVLVNLIIDLSYGLVDPRLKPKSTRESPQ